VTAPGSEAASVVVRPAQERDADELARLRWDFRAEQGLAHQPFEAFSGRFEAFVREILAGSTWRIAVAEDPDGDGLIGTAFAQLVTKVPVPNEEERHVFAYVTNVYVERARRNGRVGALLVRALVDWARERGADTVLLWPSDDSRSFYEREGFARSAGAFELRLREPVGHAGREPQPPHATRDAERPR
jgi:GNAT superfamily N-acetyltransferase